MDYVKLMRKGLKVYNAMRRKVIERSDTKVCKRRITGEKPLTKEQKKQIEEFYAPYHKVNTASHELYYEKTGMFSVKFLPKFLYTNYVDEYFNARQEGKYLDNKCYYPTIFAGINQPGFAVMRMGKFWYDSNMNIVSYDEVRRIISEEKELFLKIATESYGGKGVEHISAEKGNMFEQFETYVNGVNADIIAQHPIKQHPAYSAINESSVNTIRIMSLLTEEGVKIYSAILRCGMKGKKVDNITVGGVTCGISEDGTLKKYAYNSKAQKFEKHPTNDFVFEGYKLPYFEQAKEMVMKAHPMVPHFRLVSFDIAIGEDGEPIFVEANLCKGSAEIHEFNNGPLFGDDTEKILDEVFGKNK